MEVATECQEILEEMEACLLSRTFRWFWDEFFGGGGGGKITPDHPELVGGIIQHIHN